MRTWKVLEPDDFEETGEPVGTTCPNCWADADLPTHGHPGALIIATMGLGIVFDPPDHTPPDGWLPTTIECRRCHHIYSEGEDES